MRTIALSLALLPVAAFAQEGPAVAAADEAPTTETWSQRNLEQPADEDEDGIKGTFKHRHGVRVGYTYVESPLLAHPHLMAMGYEAQQVASPGGNLGLMFVENFTVVGLNQSVFAPSFNGLVGVEVRDAWHIGTGVNLSFLPGPNVGMIAATGVNLKAEDHFEIPLDVAWIAEREGPGRVVVTTGINWVP